MPDHAAGPASNPRAVRIQRTPPMRTGATEGRQRPPVAARRMIAILLGGMMGGGARMGVSLLLGGGSLPWATLLANVSGSLLLGYLLTRLLRASRPTTTTVSLWCTGVLGSYTTFSSFALETWQMVEQGRVLVGLAYGLGSVVVGLAAAALGIRLAQARR